MRHILIMYYNIQLGSPGPYLASCLVCDVPVEQSERDPANNIQTLWAKFKSDVTIYGRHCSRHITDETRKIEDQVKLAKFLLNYAEAVEENGIIVALDQEKAYDRINHTYMLRVLEHMGFPPKFYNTVKSLYTNAETIVMINGEMSEPFFVTRGVRQGDPLSCLLFNLAIEPLACLLRNSDLKGVKIPRKMNLL